MKKTKQTHRILKRLDSTNKVKQAESARKTLASVLGPQAVGNTGISKHARTHPKKGSDPIIGTLDDAALGLTIANDMVYSDGADLQRLGVDEQRVVGRLTAGDLAALTGAELWTILTEQAAAAVDMNNQSLTNIVIHVVANESAMANLTKVKGKACFRNDDEHLWLCIAT